MANLNKSGVTTTSYTNERQILFDAQHFVAVPIILSGTNGAVVEAGTPITGNMAARGTTMTAADANNAAVGILLHDKTVNTTGVNAQMLIHGIVNLGRLSTATAALITSNVIAELPQITFVGD